MKMYLKRSIKVPQLKLNNCLYAIYFMSAFLTIGQVRSDSNSENYANHLKKMPLTGSGHGASISSNLQKRSSYAVISQAMSETISDNEFGSEYLLMYTYVI